MYYESEYQGDDTYSVRATGDVVVGDEVCFDRATFSGSWRNAHFEGFERVMGRVVRDSYGAAKQQHTFTIEKADGSLMRIKGRNLYRQGVWRKPWADPTARTRAADEKHARGDAARQARRLRKQHDFWCPSWA